MYTIYILVYCTVMHVLDYNLQFLNDLTNYMATTHFCIKYTNCWLNV